MTKEVLTVKDIESDFRTSTKGTGLYPEPFGYNAFMVWFGTYRDVLRPRFRLPASRAVYRQIRTW